MNSNSDTKTHSANRETTAIGPQLVEQPSKRTPDSLEAYHVAEPIRDLIAQEFRVVKSSRRLAKKYRMSVRVITDCVLLAIRKELMAEVLGIPRKGMGTEKSLHVVQRREAV